MSFPITAGMLAIIGSTFILLASIGILRMPDLFLRLQVTSKASVMGLTCILLAVAFYFGSTEVTLRVLLMFCFIVLTIPVATHMLARAGYATNVLLSDETVINELAGHYDPRAHVLAGEAPVTWELDIRRDAPAIGKRVADLALPEDVLILSIDRRGEVVVPRGKTTIAGEDRLKVLATSVQMDVLQRILGANVIAVIPSTLEFPLRATTTVRELQHQYAVPIDAPPERTLAEVMSHELGKWNPQLGDRVRFGPLMMRVLRLSVDGNIELLGMSIDSVDQSF